MKQRLKYTDTDSVARPVVWPGQGQVLVVLVTRWRLRWRSSKWYKTVPSHHLQERERTPCVGAHTEPLPANMTLFTDSAWTWTVDWVYANGGKYQLGNYIYK